MTTVPVPQVVAIAIAASSARSVSHGPGSRLPSQACAAGRALTTSGAPDVAIVPLSISREIGGQQREAVRRVAEQVAVDQYRRDVARHVVAQARLAQQRLRRTRPGRRRSSAAWRRGAAEEADEA